MKTILLNANPDAANTDFEAHFVELKLQVSEKSDEIVSFNLRDMDINFCTGCWDCWWKTPGFCRFNDDMAKIYTEIPGSDQLVFVTPLILGFPPALLKKAMDRFVPLVHCYVTLVNGECHHKKRYEKYPIHKLYYYPEADTQTEDIDILTDIFKGVAVDFKSELLAVENLTKL